jgi:hypothetical protein
MIAAPLARLSRRLVSWIDPAPIDLTGDAPLAPAQYDPRLDTDSLTQWLPWLAYDEQAQLFLLEDEQPGQVGAYGFAMELMPQTGATEQMWAMFQTLFTMAPRECTSVQLQLYASPSLDRFLQAFEHTGQGRQARTAQEAQALSLTAVMAPIRDRRKGATRCSA